MVIPYLLTVLFLSGHGVFNFITLPRHAHGPSFIASIILYVLWALEAFHRGELVDNLFTRFPEKFVPIPTWTLPPILKLQMDNCGKENKNQKLTQLLACLRAMNIFERIEVNFLHTGHTHGTCFCSTPCITFST